jgi:hypothetical protein
MGLILVRDQTVQLDAFSEQDMRELKEILCQSYSREQPMGEYLKTPSFPEPTLAYMPAINAKTKVQILTQIKNILST